MISTVTRLAGALAAPAIALAWFVLPGVAQDSQAAATPPPTGYVGQDTCLTCHAEQAKGYHASAHGKAFLAASPTARQGCESCHGPGQGHVEASGDASKILRFKGKIAPGTVNAQCLTCHTKGDRALWDGSPHEGTNLSCVSCHSVHSPKSARAALKATRQSDTCATCHRAEVQKLGRTSHMPVTEGLLECSSCHNPHGSTGDKLLKAGRGVNETCQTCHAEKRGPHLWEHAPVTERCTTCHDAHGSSNDRMLVAREPFLCQRCHVTAQHPPTVYDGFALSTTAANRLFGRSCAACHQNIHGSNAPSGKAFLR